MIDKLLSTLQKRELCLEEFSNFSKTLNGYEYFEYLKASGLPLEMRDNIVSLNTKTTKVKNEIFCIVDIETNGAKKENMKIIEIGALKIKNFEVIEIFESFIFSDYVNYYVSEITGIYKEDLSNAPSEIEVLRKFKLFLGDATFIAHNVKFDYNTISNALEKHGLEKLQNRALCTLDIARRTIDAPKYGLSTLRIELGITDGVHHRALDDAKSTLVVLKHCLSKITINLKNVEELITFSKKAKMIKPKKVNKKVECELATINVNKEDMIEAFMGIQNIAIVGLSPKEEKASNQVAKYLQEVGYKIYPIYPKEELILDEKVYRSLNDIDDRIDMVVMFRKSDFADYVVDKIETRFQSTKDIQVLWLQVGIVNNNAAKRAQEMGLKVVQNQCVMIEHKDINN